MTSEFCGHPHVLVWPCKHLTHFVDVGAKRLETTGTCDDALAFENADGAVVTLVRNESEHEQLVQVQGRAVVIERLNCRPTRCLPCH